jgi:hypothetical protein
MASAYVRGSASGGGGGGDGNGTDGIDAVE